MEANWRLLRAAIKRLTFLIATQCPPSPKADITGSCLANCGPDVRVHPEQVSGVVPRLNMGEPVVAAAIGYTDILVAVLTYHGIDVACIAAERTPALIEPRDQLTSLQ